MFGNSSFSSAATCESAASSASVRRADTHEPDTQRRAMHPGPAKVTTMAWHYTVMMNFESIIMNECILPRALGAAPHARPLVWFSLNRFWENTANKGAIDPKTGERIRLSMRQTRAAGGGLVRFGIDACKLLRDDVLWQRARIEDDVRNALVEEAVQQGADPSDWCGSIKPVPVDRLVIESLNDSLQWQTFRG
jgi:hypothetical protein